MYNVSLFKFRDIVDRYGHLTPIEARVDIPFDIKRIYYITKVDEEVKRGHHSHKKLHQVLICLNGSVKVKVSNPKEEDVVELNNQSEGIYIGPMVWREMYDFSDGSVLLVLASEHYDESDYIRNHDFYLEEAKKLF